MKNRKTLAGFSIAYLLMIGIIAVISCNKKFDEPPAYVPPNITANTTIRDLKALHSTGNFEQITDDKIIEGIVVADDKSGNYFKTIVIQDETGGISLRLDAYDLYTDYPVGRRVFVKLKGLYLGDYNRLIQIGAGIDNSGSSPTLSPIAPLLIPQYLVKGELGNTVTPKVVTVAQLNDSLQNMLIQLDNFQFSDADTAKTYADPTLGSSAINFTIKNCDGNSIILRNSSYADFAGYSVPNGNGSIVAIYSVFGSTKQLNIRDTSDVQFNSDRCSGGGGGGGLVSIETIRNLYTGSGIKLGSYSIAGVVTSDAASKNISTGAIVLQDKNKGISVYFGGTITYNVGDSIIIDITGDSLISYQGSLEIKMQVGSSKPSPVATGRTVVPQNVTIATLLADFKNYEYTLVKISGATASGGTTYSGSKTLNDGTGSLTLFTSSSATFASNTLPTGAHDWTGYVKYFNTSKEIQIRNTSDVQ